MPLWRGHSGNHSSFVCDFLSSRLSQASPGDTIPIPCDLHPIVFWGASSPLLGTWNVRRTNYSSLFSRMLCDYKHTWPEFCSWSYALSADLSVAVNSRIKAKLFVLALVGERKDGLCVSSLLPFLPASTFSRQKHFHGKLCAGYILPLTKKR